MAGLMELLGGNGGGSGLMSQTALLGLAQGLLEAGGSNKPMSFGAALANGLGGMREADNDQLKQLLLLAQAKKALQPEYKTVGNTLGKLDGETGKFEPIYTGQQAAPSGYRYLADGVTLEPIPGGPGTQLPAEVAGRIGLAKKFLAEAPELEKAISEGAVTGPVDAIWGKMGGGESAKIMRRIDDGKEALVRQLTGAGKSKEEAQDYAKRFSPGIFDTKETVLDKLKNLEENLKSSASEVMVGRGGDAGIKPPAAPAPLDQKALGNAIMQAKSAIAKGANPQAVAKRLQENGIDPKQAGL